MKTLELSLPNAPVAWQTRKLISSSRRQLDEMLLLRYLKQSTYLSSDREMSHELGIESYIFSLLHVDAEAKFPVQIGHLVEDALQALR